MLIGEYKAKEAPLMFPLLNFRCGPAGWSYAHWNRSVYPRSKARRFHALEYIADLFDSVEINTSFYQPLRPEVTRLWVKKVGVNPQFLFTAKMHRSFSHERLVDDVSVAAFKEGLWPLLRSGRLGCLLMQFPSAFRFTSENRMHLINLRRAFHEFPLVAEFRHRTWMADEALGTLIDYRVGFCNIDQPQHTSAMPPTAFLTSAVGYVRLHGQNSRIWLNDFAEEAASRDSYLYSGKQLEEWKARIDKIRKHSEKVFVITNNDGAGMSVVNALQLQAMLGGPMKAPASLLSAYPEDLAGFSANQPVQRRLFASETAGRRVA
jgi:uncharacterized protein YecE (DUF72 family)